MAGISGAYRLDWQAVFEAARVKGFSFDSRRLRLLKAFERALITELGKRKKE